MATGRGLGGGFIFTLVTGFGNVMRVFERSVGNWEEGDKGLGEDTVRRMSERKGVWGGVAGRGPARVLEGDHES